MNFEKYTVDDFTSDPSFRNWVFKGKATFDWEEWLKLNPINSEEAKKAIFLLKASSSVFQQIDHEEAQFQIKNIIHLTQVGESKRILSHKLWKYTAGIAAVLLVVGFFWIQNVKTDNQKDIKAISSILVKGERSHWKTIKNLEKQNKLVVLPDGSTLLLKKGSQVSFPSTFSVNERNIYLYGEAFFEVVKNPNRPFKIYSNTFTTEVVGTSFMLRDFDNRSDSEVTVKTGNVKVSPSIFISENEKLDLSINADLSANESWSLKGIKNIEAKKQKEEVFTEKIQLNEFRYRNAKLSEVVADLEVAYTVKINLENNVIAETTLSATLGDEPFFRKLDLILMALDLEYSLNGDEINITQPN